MRVESRSYNRGGSQKNGTVTRRSRRKSPEYLLNEDGSKRREWLVPAQMEEEQRTAKRSAVPKDRTHAAQAEFHARMRRRHLAVDKLHQAVAEKRLAVMQGRMGEGGRDAAARGAAGSMDMRK